MARRFTARARCTPAGPTTLATQTNTYVDMYLGGRATWTNSGNVTVGGQIDFGVYAADTASFINQAGGVFSLTDDYADIDAYTSYDTATFSNVGLLEKTGGTATSAIYAKVTNTGSIVAASGTMAFYSGGSFGGSLSGAGNIAFSGGTSTLTATAATANLLVNGGTLDVGVNETVGSLAISSGELAFTGNDTMTVTGAFSAAGGAGGQPDLDLPSHGETLKLTGASSFGSINAYGPYFYGTIYTAGATTLATQTNTYVDMYLGDGGTWTNSGTATIGGQIDFGFKAADTASFVNQAGGVFNLIDDYADIDAYTSYDTATFSNAGLLEKTGGTGTSAIYAVMTNTGSIVAASGTLAFYSGGSFGGSLSGAGYIAFSGGTNTLTATAATANLLVNGGTLDVDINETVGSLAMSTGGTLAVTGSNTVTVSGAFSMAGQGGGLSLVTLASGGTLKLAGAASFDTINAYGPEISGPGTLSTSAATTLATQTTNYVGLYLSAGATWTNSGTATIGGQIDFGVFAADTASFINQAGGVFNLIDDYADIDAYTSYDTATFSNAGLLEKTGGTGTSAIYATVTNTGSIVAASGTMAFYSGGSFGGSLSGAGYIAFSGGSSTLTATAATANLLVNGGTLDVGVNETVGSLAISSGELAVTGSDTMTVSGAFSAAGGGGQHEITLVSGATLELNGSASFDTVNAYGPSILGPGTLYTAGATTLATQAAAYVDLYLGGRATWTNSGNVTVGGQIDFGVYAADTASFINQAGGVFNLTDDYADIDAYTSYDTATFSNAGLLEKTGGTATSAIYAKVTNTGSIVAASGTTAFYSGGSFGGSLSGAGYIAFSGGTSTLTATAATANLLVNGGTLDVGVNETVGSLAISSGELAVTGSDTMTVSGAFSAAGGGGQHEITLVSGATLKLNGSASFDTVNAYGPSILGPGTLYTAGATTLATQAAAYVDLYLGGGGTWTNSGIATIGGQIDFGLTAADTASFVNQAGGVVNLTDDYASIVPYTSYDSATFSNAGLLEKTGNTGVSAIDATLTNTGTMLVSSGTLSLPVLTNLSGTTLTGGTFEATAGAVLELANNTTIATAAATIILSGTGSALQSLNTSTNTQVGVDFHAVRHHNDRCSAPARRPQLHSRRQCRELHRQWTGAVGWRNACGNIADRGDGRDASGFRNCCDRRRQHRTGGRKWRTAAAVVGADGRRRAGSGCRRDVTAGGQHRTDHRQHHDHAQWRRVGNRMGQHDAHQDRGQPDHDQCHRHVRRPRQSRLHHHARDHR